MAQITIQQAFDLALRHHQAGRLHDARLLYQQILVQQPTHAEAIHLLGVIAHQSGRNDIAVDLIRRAIVLRPGYAEAHCNLGVALKDMGELDEAIEAYRQAIALAPSFADAHSNLGFALKDKGQLDEAIAACRQAIILDGNLAEAHNNLGAALAGKGRNDEAIAAFGQAINLRPNYAEAHDNFGVVLRNMGRLDESIAACRRAVALGPNSAEAHCNLSVALKDKGHLDEAIAACRQAIALRPSFVEAYNNLGVALKDTGQLDESIAACRRAIALKPDYAEAHYNLGVALGDKSQLDEAIAAYRQAVALRPDFAEAYCNLGAALKDTGQLDEAIAAYRQAIALRPNYVKAHSSLIYSLHFHPDYDGQGIAEEYRRWNRLHAEPLKIQIRPHTNNFNSERRLRIGYVSPDFREHPVGRFLMPLMEHHDHGQFEIYCYSDVQRPDSMTERIRSRTDAWRNIVAMTDEAAAALIRQDGIDILVDLTMHMAHNRLLVFARKPAPIQVTYLAYCSTTGLDTIDYRLTDSHLDPPGNSDQYYSEQSIRLPDVYWRYDPGVETPDVAPLPALDAGHITFGCLNNFAKVSPEALSTWGRLLLEAPSSRLVLHARAGEHRQRTLDQLQRNGVNPVRITFVDFLRRHDYVRQYHRIDIGLDPFPYAGGTTTCDALWMGVPVITLAGRTAVARSGVTLLAGVGLSDLVAGTQDDYIQRAVQLAANLPELAQLRAGLRDRMLRSPLMDAPTFARGVEAAYRGMWNTWRQAIRAV